MLFRKLTFILAMILFGSYSITAQDSDETTDSLSINSKEEKVKTGWSLGGVPAVAYDSDIGFKYGVVLELWDYGDGTLYPNYDHSMYFEFSRTTKGSGILEFQLDSKKLIEGIRSTFEASYLTERALDFYGFNGYQTLYNSEYENDDANNTEYISRLYYRQERKLLRLRSDFQGRFFSDKAKWVAGVTYYNIKTDTVDIDRLNKGKAESEKLPYYNGGLFGQYAHQWNVIPEDQINGGSTTLIKGGLMFDTRDNEPNPMKGIWTEAILMLAPNFLSSGDQGYAKLSLTHRQYFTLVPDRLSLVYRIGYQDKLWGTMPYYMLPLVLNAGNAKDRDGLGGAKTIRGLLRNRIVGDDFVYGNIELRWKFLKTVVLNQNIYLALNTFLDYGMVTSKYNINLSGVPEEALYMFPDVDEELHLSYGLGFHIAMNENFVIAINNGFAVDKRDGDSGLYIGLKWLF